MTRRINDAGLALVKQFEGCRLDAYLCPAGVPTIGYGHTAGVEMGASITQEQADEMLREDLHWAEWTVAEGVKVPLTENQHAALCSLIFNIGSGHFLISTLLKKLNHGEFLAMPKEFRRWNKVGTKVAQGLTNRRAAEAALWAS